MICHLVHNTAILIIGETANKFYDEVFAILWITDPTFEEAGKRGSNVHRGKFADYAYGNNQITHKYISTKYKNKQKTINKIFKNKLFLIFQKPWFVRTQKMWSCKRFHFQIGNQTTNLEVWLPTKYFFFFSFVSLSLNFWTLFLKWKIILIFWIF